jgi:antitoxin ParD1/3/4
MTSSVHVSLPDEMRAFVDMRANGKSQYTTPSEYVRALIREDMAREEDRRYAIRSLLRAEEEFRRGEMLPLLESYLSGGNDPIACDEIAGQKRLNITRLLSGSSATLEGT